ncbi:acyltransferase family protein [Streptomyces sp. 4N509B]|uniref:acyltransferase family protein n=1 Tax=Streptomyces sp. 4N509B TaxID=3457413 RepID=UPI003FD552B0
MQDTFRGWRDRFAERRDARAARRQSRDPHWDNVRYVAGTLVIFVHLSNSLADHAGLNWLYVATWAMRVPAFVLVAGYFSRADTLTPREARRLIESVAVPYLVIGVLHTLQMGPKPNGEWIIHVLDPAWGMWFLLSLMCWRVALPYLAQLRYPLTASMVLALGAGYVAAFDTTVSLGRTFAFLPFFVLGWQIREGLFARAMTARWGRNLALAVVAGAFVAGWFLRNIDGNWLRMKGPYEDLVTATTWAWAGRGAVLLLGMAVALSFLRLMPRRRLPFVTYLGVGGMYIYLLHPLVLRPLDRRDAWSWVPDSWLGVAVALLAAVVMSAVLASPPVRWLTRPLIQPRLPWLFRRESTPPGPERPVPAKPGATPPPPVTTTVPVTPAGLAPGVVAGATPVPAGAAATPTPGTTTTTDDITRAC